MYLSRLGTSRFGKAIRAGLLDCVTQEKSEIDKWITGMKEDEQLFEEVKADEIRLIEQTETGL